jgi:biotin carboxyl carrier protein
MKLTAEISGEQHEVELRREDTHIRASVSGRDYELEARETESGSLLLLHGGRVYECRVEAAGAGASKVEVAGREFEVALFDPRRLRAAGAVGGAAAGRAVVAASIPGKVVRVLVEEGAEVRAGDGLVVVEAMKMQNELKSSKDGRVTELRARAGATVNAGEVLAIVE